MKGWSLETDEKYLRACKYFSRIFCATLYRMKLRDGLRGIGCTGCEIGGGAFTRYSSFLWWRGSSEYSSMCLIKCYGRNGSRVVEKVLEKFGRFLNESFNGSFFNPSASIL